MRTKLLGWIGWAVVDIVGRLVILAGSTAFFSRILTPHDFGVTALVLIVVTIAAVFVGAPFEEALAQRATLRRSLVEAALSATWLVAAFFLLISVPLGVLIGQLYHEPEISRLLPVAMLSLFFSGHADIMTGVARRLRRFNDAAIATLVGHVVGIALSIALGLLGFGLWALMGQRLLVVVVRALVLQWRIGIVFRPRWSPSELAGLNRFAKLSLLDRLADNLNFFAFNTVVGALYGVTALGHVNMAMRLIEPIRGAFLASGHNFAFSFFAAVQHDAPLLRQRADVVVSRAAHVIAPTFIGLAAVMPILLPLMAGPGWEDAIPIAMLLGIGSAIVLPSRLFFSAQYAVARAEYSVFASFAGVAGTLLTLIGLSSLGTVSIGLSRVVGDAVQAACAVSFAPRSLAWPRLQRLRALIPAWRLAPVMGVLVYEMQGLLSHMPQVPALIISIGLGLLVYLALLFVFARADFKSLRDLVPVRRTPLQFQR